MTDTSVDLHVDKASGEAFVQPRPDHRMWKLQLRELLDGEREAAGLTVAALAARIGVTHATMAGMLRGTRPINLDDVHAVCYVLGIRLAPPTVDRSGL